MLNITVRCKMYTYILSKSQNIKSAKLERLSFCWDDWERRSNMNKTGFSRFFVLLIDIKKSDEYFLNYFLEDNKFKRDNIFLRFSVIAVLKYEYKATKLIWIPENVERSSQWKLAKFWDTPNLLKLHKQIEY